MLFVIFRLHFRGIWASFFAERFIKQKRPECAPPAFCCSIHRLIVAVSFFHAFVTLLSINGKRRNWASFQTWDRDRLMRIFAVTIRSVGDGYVATQAQMLRLFEQSSMPKLLLDGEQPVETLVEMVYDFWINEAE